MALDALRDGRLSGRRHGRARRLFLSEGRATSPDPAPRVRLDQVLVDRGLYATRSRARDAILRGAVMVAGRRETKPGALVDPAAAIAAEDPAARYVSRGALKLIAGLDAFGLSPAGRACLDVGASTGGFTQVLIERGARSVAALDVGHGQLHPRIAGDPRVRAIEGLNARDLTVAHLDEAPDFVVADVSFIPLRLALPPALRLAAAGASGIFLVKPQFEVGREHVSKGGLVRDDAAAEAAVDEVERFLGEAGWTVSGRIPSPIEGGDGNREFLVAAVKS